MVTKVSVEELIKEMGLRNARPLSEYSRNYIPVCTLQEGDLIDFSNLCDPYTEHVWFPTNTLSTPAVICHLNGQINSVRICQLAKQIEGTDGPVPQCPWTAQFLKAIGYDIHNVDAIVAYLAGKKLHVSQVSLSSSIYDDKPTYAYTIEECYKSPSK